MTRMDNLRPDRADHREWATVSDGNDNGWFRYCSLGNRGDCWHIRLWSFERGVIFDRCGGRYRLIIRGRVVLSVGQIMTKAEKLKRHRDRVE